MNSTLNWNEIRASHEDLSAADWSFRQFASEERDCLRRSTFDRPHPLRSLVTYGLQPWPVFLGRRKVQELATIGKGLSRLVRSIPQRVFHNDPGRISEFYGLNNSSFIAEILAPPNAIAEAVSRGDFAAGASGLKCLEFNCAGNLGGWESAIMADMLLRVPVIDRFLRELKLKVSVTNTLRVMLSYAVRKAEAAGLRDGGEINMALVASQEAYLLRHPMARQVFAGEYAAACREVIASATGEFILLDDSDCALRQDHLYGRGRRIHSLITAQESADDDMIFKVFKAGNLHLYNGPITLLLNDKRNLAILSELENSEIFDTAERAMIRNHVPWTRCITAAKTSYRGEAVTLPKLLISEREHLVLKKAQSSGGRDVVAGRTTAPERWARAVREAVAGGDWVVQEFVESRPYLFQEGDDGCSPHDLVWGVFVFGDTYGGTTVRVLPKAAEGTVSATRGATKSLLLELEE